MRLADIGCEAFARPSRRTFLASAGALAASAGSFVAWANLPKTGFAGTRDPRLVVVILRGAVDGLAVVPPVGDPDYVALRDDLAIGVPGIGGALPLNDFFALNDALPLLHGRYKAGEALVVHATATPYRERSHFDGQDVLESGLERPAFSETGWLNRAVAALPAGDQVAPRPALAITPIVPQILRGYAPTLTWTPPRFGPVDDDTALRLLALYSNTDPELARVYREGLMGDAFAGASLPSGAAAGAAGVFQQLATGAVGFLADPNGPRVAVLSYDGWDTHINEGPDDGRLAHLLAALDGSLEALATGLKDVWSETVVAVITEFGRTARKNGSEGTDHGTATVALLVGGGVRGGRVLADWPGLKEVQLFQGRDLAPTIDLRAVLKGVLRDHLGLSERVLSTDVFPGSLGVRPLDDLLLA